MSVEVNQVEKQFTFQFPTCTTNQKYKLEIPILLPYSGSVEELTQRLISSFKLPCYIEKDLLSALDTFIKEESIEYFDDIGEKLVSGASSGSTDIEGLVKSWERWFKEETSEYADRKGATDEEVFSSVYHELVHSPALETILQAEHSYAQTVREVTAQRDAEIEALTAKQTSELCAAVEGSSEQELSALAAQHCEDQNMLHGRWNSRVDVLMDSQRHEYRDWLMRMLEERHTGCALPMRRSPVVSRCEVSDSSPRLEESFTIHLGSQMKQMHNIRILSADVVDLCRSDRRADNCVEPRRLQTALALYSHDLCGLVVFTDDHVDTYSGLNRELSTVCEESCEFHFAPLDAQLEAVRSRSLRTGDVYVTRHSNLADAHLIFHAVTDASIKSNDINSRHPVILGLRNVLKTACSNDVTTLTVPVLLMHEMTEEMTVAWCTKRAELVFKCIKGFMIEMASWGGSELKNLQFLVPKGMSEEVFGLLATMLPSIFRVSNPLVLKASTPHA